MLTGYEKRMVKERIFELSRIEKKVGETKPGTTPLYLFLANNSKCHEVPTRHRPGSSSGGHLEPKSPKTWWGVIFRGGFFFNGPAPVLVG